MRILTLNTWQERGPWEKRWEVFFGGLEEYRPDIIAFQETFNRSWGEEVQKRTGFEHLVFPPEHSGLSLLSRFPVSHWECLTMKAQSPTEDYLRYVIFAELSVGQGELAVFNTHLSWKLDEGEIRERQVDELLDFMDQKAVAREAVAMGDFNTPSNTAEIRKMVLQGKWVDTFAVKHPKEPGLTWDNRNPYASGSGVSMPDRRIDYIFLRNASKILGKLTSMELVYTKPDKDGIFASDHFGLLATFD